MNSLKKHAFTLAEIIVVIGIIGVIAAITIPPLINNYQKNMYVTQLKKFYSTFNTGIKTYMATNNCSDLICTGLFDGRTGEAIWDNKFKTEIPKIFKVVQIYTNDREYELSHELEYKSTYLKKSGDPYTFETPSVFVTADGFMINLLDNDSGNCQNYPNATTKLKNFCVDYVFVDVNGRRGPNKRHI